ncbi:MAG: hypothetical protein L3K00_02045 [Thermoplasmata archaeon]|nr:hypothetical protein [Thermoplasmata archaeon]
MAALGIGALVALLLLAYLPPAAPPARFTGTPGGTPRLTADSSVYSCTESALASAVAGGGNGTFTLTRLPLTLTTPISITTGLTVNIPSGRNTVELSGGGTSQLFVASGGRWNVTGIFLEFGDAKGKVGKTGSAGTTGASGTTGLNGLPGSPGSGAPGTAGTGAQGTNGVNGVGRFVNHN